MDNIARYIDLIVLLLLPGFISSGLYNILCQKERILNSQFRYTILVWGALNYVLIYPFTRTIHLHELKLHTYYFYIFVVPCLTGLVISLLRYLLPEIISSMLKNIIKPCDSDKDSKISTMLNSLKKFEIGQVWPTPWNKVFSQIKGYWIRVYLKNGSLIGGVLEKGSYMSAYPTEEQIYLQKVWILDENKNFKAPVEDSEGIIIFKDEILAVELLKAQEEDGDET